MLHHIKKLFGIKKKEEVVAPYKVEVAPVPAGTPLVNDAGKVVAIADGNPAPGPKVTAAKKKPAAKKTAGEKKPRAPRKPKAS